MSSSTPPKRLKIFFFSVDAAGHLAACYGLAQSLVKRGHDVSFFLDPSFKGQAEAFGCKEILFTPKPSEEGKESEAAKSSENPIKAIANDLLTSGMIGKGSAFEKMKAMLKMGFFQRNYDTTLHRCNQIAAEIEAQAPDVFIVDTLLIPPAILSMKFVYSCSANPLFLFNSPKLPPGCSGYRTDSDPATWAEMQKYITEEHFPVVNGFQDRLNAHFNYTGTIPEYANVHHVNVSPYLNLYAIPQELDYSDIITLPENFVQVDAFCRMEAKPFSLPQAVKDMPGKALIYFSMGSMGGIDLELMQRLLAILAKTPYKYIVSKGPRHAEIELPANCWGEQYLPQTAILPLVDLVITHGGNNTLTECFTFGKKMIILGLFGDQLDNGARVTEKGLGVAFNPYDFEEQQFVEAIDRLVADEALTARMKAIAERIARDDTKRRACEAIEKLCA